MNETTYTYHLHDRQAAEGIKITKRIHFAPNDLREPTAIEATFYLRGSRDGNDSWMAFVETERVGGKSGGGLKGNSLWGGPRMKLEELRQLIRAINDEQTLRKRFYA